LHHGYGSSAQAADRSPFADAVAAWQMGDRNDSSGKNSALTISGDVKVGVALDEPSRAASLRRGGDGRVAEFNGGWLSAGQGNDGELNLAGKALTLCVRLRDPTGKWNTPILAKHGGHAQLTYNLFSTDLGRGVVLGFELGTDFKDRPLQLAVPIQAIGPTDWHDVIVRYSGPRIEMFLDGVLVDEEWPVGTLRQGNTEPCLIGAESYAGRVVGGFRGQIDHAALWDRALSDDEIALLSGGKDAAAVRRQQILGEPNPCLQYWKPPGHNTSVGDCMPFFHDGVFHLFYLFDRRHHRSKFGLGAHQWAHASSRDLIHWTHHPLAIPITEEREASICTGSVFFHEGTFYAYYATRLADGTGERLSLATSKDGVRFEKTLPNPFAGPPPGYGPRDYRDPNVFQDPKTGLFHMLVAARLADARGGCLAQLLSKDLRDWKPSEPFLVTGFVPECPDHFLWNGWYYLISTRYWMSRSPTGPWTSPKAPALDVLPVPKTAAFTGNRRIYVSWLRDGGWGGCTVFREVVQRPDGTLGTRFLPELIPASGDPVALRPAETGPAVSRQNGPIVIRSPKAIGEVNLAGLPRNVRLTARVVPQQGTAGYGLRFGGGNAQQAKETELRFDLPARQVRLSGGATIHEVDGLDQPFEMDIILKDDVLDVCIANQRTLIGRTPAGRGERATLFVEKGQVTFDKLEARPLR
jgi:hypothetical protein